MVENNIILKPKNSLNTASAVTFVVIVIGGTIGYINKSQYRLSSNLCGLLVWNYVLLIIGLNTASAVTFVVQLFFYKHKQRMVSIPPQQ